MKPGKSAVWLMLLLAAAMRVQATEMFMVGLEQLATQAEEIVQARVTAVVMQWNKDSTMINTYIRANIVDDLLGPDEDHEIIIAQPGGRISGRTLHVCGVANYSVGENNMLFLFKDPKNPASYQTIGMYQGKYRIYTGTDQVERVAQDDAHGVTLHKRAADGDSLETGNNLTLEEFKQRILKYRNGQ
ncbi:MAG: hypothetical protein GF418_15450 [Chitinivibrionales bacterium]|nr:hypothetical protein [Chitinivibrionales bacterium]MBD3397017.1 hypothetical protein [Chitinivibrionales bacterium]